MKTLMLTRKKAIKLFKQMGFQTAGDWSDKQLERKLNNVSDLMEYIRLDTFKMKKTFTKITRSDSVVIRSEKFIEESKKKESSTVTKKKKSKKKAKVEESVTEEVVTKKKKSKSKTEKSSKKSGDEKSKKKSKNKTAKDSKKKSKKKDSTDEAGSKIDKFGARLGTIKASIGAGLTKKSQTMQELLEKTGVENSQTGYLNDLIKAGLVKKGEKGYSLVA